MVQGIEMTEKLCYRRYIIPPLPPRFRVVPTLLKGGAAVQSPSLLWLWTLSAEDNVISRVRAKDFGAGRLGGLNIYLIFYQKNRSAPIYWGRTNPSAINADATFVILIGLLGE